MPILKEQTLTRTYGLIDALRREGRTEDAATAIAGEPVYLTATEGVKLVLVAAKSRAENAR